MRLADRVLLFAAMALLMGSIVSFHGAGRRYRSGQPDTTGETWVERADGTMSEGVAMSLPPVVAWLAPVHDRTHWAHDLFTPPDVFYDEVAQGFTGGRLKSDPPPPGDVLLATAAELQRDSARDEAKAFPLQLVGSVGHRARLRGVFENVATGETVVAGCGRVFADLGLVIENVAMRRVEADNGNLVANTITAVIRDQSGRAITLTDGVRCFVSEAAGAKSPSMDTETFREPVANPDLAAEKPQGGIEPDAPVLNNFTAGSSNLQTDSGNSADASAPPTA